MSTTPTKTAKPDEPLPARHLTSGAVLARSSLLNLLGTGLPLVVGVLAIPLLLKGLGPDRFGVLTLAWTVVGYFSLFDLGLGRGLTQAIAEKLGSGRNEDIPQLAAVSLLILLLMGLVGVVVVGLLCPLLTYRLLHVPVELQRETLIALWLLAGSLPLVICTSGMSGILEAYQRFDLINAIRLPLGLVNYLGPLLVLPLSQSLIPVTAVLVIGRLLSGGVHLWLCLRLIPRLRWPRRVHRGQVGPLLRCSTWMNVSNIVGPIITSLDRFLIAGMQSVAAAAYYTTPYEVALKLTLIPSTLVQVLFPAFATSLVSDRRRAAVLFNCAVRYLLLGLFPPTLLIIAFAEEILSLWLGAVVALHSTRVLQWLMVGVFTNCLARVPYALIQGAGRAEATGKLHLWQLPFSIVLTWLCIRGFGIDGAAFAWTLRATTDMVCLFLLARPLLDSHRTIRRSIGTVLAGVLPLLGGLLLPTNASVKGAYCLTIGVLLTALAYRWIVTADERFIVSQIIRHPRRSLRRLAAARLAAPPPLAAPAPAVPKAA